MADYVMPSLGADMDAGTLLEWLVEPGQEVRRGEIVATVDTSKAEIDIEIFEDAVIEELLAQPGDRVPVGTPIARIRPVAKRAGAATGAAEAASPPEVVSAPEPQATGEGIAWEQGPPAGPPPPAAGPALAPQATGNGASAAHRPRVSPLARRVAADLGVDLAGVAGTGTGGAVTRADVERAAATAEGAAGRAIEPVVEEPAPAAATATSPEPAAPAAKTAPAERAAAMRAAIAALMARSKREIPHYYLSHEIDMTAALAWLEQHNAELPMGERVLPAALMLRAVALAAGEVPELNGHWVEGAFRASPAAHVGVAVSLREGGLVAPAILDAQAKDVDALMGDLRDLVRRARRGAMRASEMSAPTITVTNLGEQGVGAVFGVIYPPQVALVGFGRVSERPWARDGMVGARPAVTATLAADHRASDGHRGALFLAAVAAHLEDPESL